MNSLRLYDWSTAPLLQLAGGGQSQNITLDNTGAYTLAVQSQGAMNSAQRSLRVAVKVNNNRQYVSLLSQEGYKEVGSLYMDSFASFAPPVAMHNLKLGPQPWYTNTKHPLDYLISSAQAAPWDSWTEAWDAVKSTVSFLVPYEDFLLLGKQLYYLGTQDWDNFNAVDLSFAALGVATIIPIMKPLKQVVDPLKTFIKKYGNKPIIKALAGVLGRAAEEAAKGRTEKLLNLLPYFLIVVEMTQDADALEFIPTMVDSIGSAEDLWARIEYFNLPMGGWEGAEEDPIPSVAWQEIERFNLEQQAGPIPAYGVAFKSMMDALVLDAHAKSRKPRSTKDTNNTKPRLTGAQVGELFGGLMKTFRPQITSNPKQLSLFIKEFVKGMKETTVSSMRRLVFNPIMLRSGFSILSYQGAKNLRHLLKGKSNARLSPLTIVAVIAYLESRMSNETCDDLTGCELLLSDLHNKVRQKYAQALGEFLAGNNPNLADRMQVGLYSS